MCVSLCVCLPSWKVAVLPVDSNAAYSGCCMCLCAHINVCVHARSRQDVETAHLKLLMHMTRQHRISPHEISTSERTDIAKRNLNPHTHVWKIRKSFFSIFIVKWISVVGVCACVCVWVWVSVPHSRCDAPQHTNQLDHWELPIILLWNHEPTGLFLFSIIRLFHFSALERILQVRRFITTSQKMS